MIIDNFLPPEQFAKLQEAVFKMGNFPWFYVESASLKPEDNDVVDKFAVETDGFYHPAGRRARRRAGIGEALEPVD